MIGDNEGKKNIFGTQSTLQILRSIIVNEGSKDRRFESEVVWLFLSFQYSNVLTSFVPLLFLNVWPHYRQHSHLHQGTLRRSSLGRGQGMCLLPPLSLILLLLSLSHCNHQSNMPSVHVDSLPSRSGEGLAIQNRRKRGRNEQLTEKSARGKEGNLLMKSNVPSLSRSHLCNEGIQWQLARFQYVGIQMNYLLAVQY